MGPELFVATLALGLASGALFGLRNLTVRLRIYLLKSEDDVKELKTEIDDLKRELEEVKGKMK